MPMDDDVEFVGLQGDKWQLSFAVPKGASLNDVTFHVTTRSIVAGLKGRRAKVRV